MEGHEFEIFPAISTFFIALSAILVAIGWKQILNKKREQHQKTMFWAAIAAIIFLLFMPLGPSLLVTQHGVDRIA